MSIVRTDAVIIKGFRYGETGKIITLFSKDFGKFNALVKSTRSVKSNTSGVFDNLNYITISFNRKENRDLQFLSKGDTVNSFSKIKLDLDKLSVAYRILELINHATHEYDSNPELFALVTECLSYLNDNDRNYGNYLIYFQANLLKLIGIKPDLVEDNPTIIDGIVAEKQETFNPANALKLNRKEYSIVNSLFDKEIGITGEMNLAKGEVEKLGNMFDHYLSNHLGKSGYLKTKNILLDMNI